MTFKVVPATCSSVLGYVCKNCDITTRLSKGEMEEKNLTVCQFCFGTGKVKLFDQPIGYLRVDGHNSVPMMPSLSFNPEDYPERLVKCEHCGGKGWYVYWDGTN